GEWGKLTSELCKAYLRYYGLRLSDSKADLISRIQRHYELKDFQSAKRQYPRASFFINCTGDVCRNDVVLFNQRISTRSVSTHERKATHGGYRLVAGRVVSESYGVKKQQHTFTVEVIWTSGAHALAPMTQLLVKGRVLYRHKTFRQKWPNEAERVAAIAEKHARGDEARSMREKRLASKSCRNGRRLEKALTGKRRERPSIREKLAKTTSTRRGSHGRSTHPSRGRKRPRCEN
ncbi:unnamed protein product, partial [Closterium sp. Naga37s-1]